MRSRAEGSDSLFGAATSRGTDGSRQPFMSSGHLVVAGHYLAAQAGHDVLTAGGNAVDAGVAAGICLGVVQSDMVNFGGVAPIMIRMAETAEVITISGLGWWPQRARAEVFREEFGGALPAGVLRSVVPGAPDAWITALERYGTMSFGEVAAPAIELAARGFPVHPLFAETVETHAADYERWPSSAAIYLPNGRPPKVGELFVQSDLAGTLQFMAAEEKAAAGSRRAGLEAARRSFYRGDIARQIASFYRTEGGWLEFDDLASFRSAIEAPVARRFGDLEVYTCGPWCQGPVLHQMLAILESFDLDALAADPVQYWHVVIEAMRIAFFDRERSYGDPRFVEVPLDELLSARYGESCAASIRRSRVQELSWAPSPEAPSIAAGPKDTSYVGVVDRAGNVFSATPSDVSYDVPVTPGTGICVSSRGAQSWTAPEHPSVLAPGKRPRLTPNPAIVIRPGELFMPIGTPGGDVQTQAVLQVLLNLFVRGMDVQTAIDAPRVATYDQPDSFAPHARQPLRVLVEPGCDPSAREGLGRLGHDVRDWSAQRWKAGGVCAIMYDPRTGVGSAGIDSRRPSGVAGR